MFHLGSVGALLVAWVHLHCMKGNKQLRHVSVSSSSFAALSSSKEREDGSAFDMRELSKRIQSLQQSEQLLQQASSANASCLSLPVVVMDSLLPNQRLAGTTSDATFGRLLRDVGIGGYFVMTSINSKYRFVRRNGVIARIQFVDAPATSSLSLTSVDFEILGKKHCRLLGPSVGMTARVGRWRREYDPDGEAAVLGWGHERFLDAQAEATSNQKPSSLFVDNVDTLSCTEWTCYPVDCAVVDHDAQDDQIIQFAQSILPLLAEWQDLAGNLATYENVDVTAMVRIAKGQPGIRVNPSALLRSVLHDLGPQPSASLDPTAFALWGAALINPLPPLGVSPEIRGRVLEAPDAMNRLKILDWGVRRSIGNLKGSDPL